MKSIFQKLKNDFGSVRFERLGNDQIRNKVKSQPLLIRFGKHEDPVLFLKNKNLLPKGTFANFGRTKEQRMKYNKLKKHTLSHNRHNPSQKKFIKFVHGEPVLLDRQNTYSSEAPFFDITSNQATQDSDNVSNFQGTNYYLNVRQRSNNLFKSGSSVNRGGPARDTY